MQGRLIERPVSVRIDSQCGVCAEPIRIEVDQDLRFRASGDPFILEPSVDWSRFRDPNIIHAY